MADDITKPKQLGRIYRKMKKFATPIQYSLFLFEGSRQQLQGYLKEKGCSKLQIGISPLKILASWVN